MPELFLTLPIKKLHLRALIVKSTYSDNIPKPVPEQTAQIGDHQLICFSFLHLKYGNKNAVSERCSN